MPFAVYHPETGKHGTARDQAQYDRLFKPAGWVKEGAAVAGDDANAGRIADLEARVEALETMLTAPPESPPDDASDGPFLLDDPYVGPTPEPPKRKPRPSSKSEG